MEVAWVDGVSEDSQQFSRTKVIEKEESSEL